MFTEESPVCGVNWGQFPRLEPSVKREENLRPSSSDCSLPRFRKRGLASSGEVVSWSADKIRSTAQHVPSREYIHVRD